MTLFGLPIGSIVALAAVVVLPLLAYVLYRVDVARNEGLISILGYRDSSE